MLGLRPRAGRVGRKFSQAEADWGQNQEVGRLWLEGTSVAGAQEAQRLRQARARFEHGREVEVEQDTLGSVELIPRTGILRDKAWTRRCCPLWVLDLLKLWHRRMAKGTSMPSLTPWSVRLLSTGAVTHMTAATHMPRTTVAIPSCSPTPGIVSIRESCVVSSQHNTQQQPLTGA